MIRLLLRCMRSSLGKRRKGKRSIRRGRPEKVKDVFGSGLMVYISVHLCRIFHALAAWYRDAIQEGYKYTYGPQVAFVTLY